MKTRKIDNFKTWRDEQKRLGLMKSAYPLLQRSGDLAELIGVVLGDGHIGKHPRCESLRIVGSGNNPGFSERYAALVERIFEKKPHVALRSRVNAINITVYQKGIAQRLDIPSGSRANHDFTLPKWIEDNRGHKLRFLRGLYEAEGSVSHHKETYTHKFEFANKNPALLNVVFQLVSELGFHPHRSKFKVQVSRKEEVQNLPDLLQFRRYEQ